MISADGASLLLLAVFLFVIIVVCTGGALHTVEVRRGKGDNLEFSKFYRSLMDSKVRYAHSTARS